MGVAGCHSEALPLIIFFFELTLIACSYRS
jgi:hypothetical protein